MIKYEIITKLAHYNWIRSRVEKEFSHYHVANNLPDMTITIMGTRRDRYLVQRVAENIKSYTRNSVTVIEAKVKVNFL